MFSCTLPLTSALRWVWVVKAMPRPLYPQERPGNDCTIAWVGPRAGLNGCGKSRPPPAFDSRTIQHVASPYTEWGIPALGSPVKCKSYLTVQQEIHAYSCQDASTGFVPRPLFATVAVTFVYLCHRLATLFITCNWPWHDVTKCLLRFNSYYKNIRIIVGWMKQLNYSTTVSSVHWHVYCCSALVPVRAIECIRDTEGCGIVIILLQDMSPVSPPPTAPLLTFQ